MTLNEATLLDLMQHPASEELIEKCIELQDEHRIHITGEGYEKHIKQIKGYETWDQFVQKRELSEPATMVLTQKIMDEHSRWENAQGTKKFYEFKNNAKLDKDFKEVLNECWKGESMSYFVHEFLKVALYTDFCGFVFVEQPEVKKRNKNLTEVIKGLVRNILSPNKNPQPYLIFKPIEDVHDFKSKGNKVEYLITYFGEITRKDSKDPNGRKIKLFRAVDDKWDRIVEKDGGKFKISQEGNYKPIENTLGYVPAVQISTRKNNVLIDEVKTSFIKQVIPLLKTYLTDWAEHVISKILHAHPIYWQRGMMCRYSEGEKEEGKCDDGWINYVTEGGETIDKQCPNCKGTGAVLHKDATVALILPQLDEEGKSYDVRDAAGYVTPPIDILVHQLKELDWQEEKIYFSGTGVRSLPITQIEKTATEAILNLKPLADIIGNILDNIEYIETFLTNTIGKLFFKDRYIRCQITYSRNLNLREEYMILREITEAKGSGASNSYIKTLHTELIHSRYHNSPIELERNLILSELEPLIGYTTQEIFEKKSTCGDFIDIDTKFMKNNFTDYIVRFENEKQLITDYKEDLSMEKRIELIRDELIKYNQEILEKVRISNSGESNIQGISNKTDSE